MLRSTAQPRPALVPTTALAPRETVEEMRRYRAARARIDAQRRNRIGAYGYLRHTHD